MCFVLAMLLVVTMLATAGGEAEGTTGRSGDAGQLEAPVLASMVAAGELPPLEARLPSNPMIIDDMPDGVGSFGGTINKTWLGPSNDRWGMAKNSEEFLVMISQDGSDVVPNIAHDLEILDGSRRFRFHLREGLRWSDGDDFTTEDVLFFWEEIVLAELTRPVNPVFFTGDNELARVEVIDDYTFDIVQAEPYYNFPIEFTMQIREFFYPAHYGRTILPAFIGEDAALQSAQAEGFANLEQYLAAKTYYFWVESDVPSMRAFVPVNDSNDAVFRTERNPYYWKVDRDGRQLPYVDGISYRLVEDVETIVLAAIAGEIDFQDRRIEAQDFTILMENRDRGDYDVIRWVSSNGSDTNIVLNQAVPDPVLREIFADVRFRRALSVAVDRQELVDLVEDGLASPRQASILPGGAYYSESWERAYAQYDPDLANRLLDEMGLEWDANREWRLRPDGEVLEVVMTIQTIPGIVNPYEIIEDYIRRIGVRWIVRPVDRSLREDLLERREHEATHTDFQGWNFVVRPTAYVPVQPDGTWHGAYYDYITSDGASGIEPEGDVAELIEVWDELGRTPIGPQRDALAERVVELHEENLWVVGYYGGKPVISVFSNRLGNRPPDGLIHTDPLRSPLNARPFIWYFK
ncbi:MAG: ABC transporter substrate-binding protein [Spirochaetales bacterium]|nr:ABC transporter substrate-binding protein [Spirochaetales bacterium]